MSTATTTAPHDAHAPSQALKKIAHGLSKNELINLVVCELSAKNAEHWRDVQLEECAKFVAMDNCSGLGGSQTYKVTLYAEPAEPGRETAGEEEKKEESDAEKKNQNRTQLSRVVLNVRGDHADYGDLVFRRILAGANLLHEHKLGPRVLANGEDYVITAWAGNKTWEGFHKMKAREWGEMGKALAMLHNVPTTWFDGFREELKSDAQFPDLKDISLDSHAWVYCARGCPGSDRHWSAKKNAWGALTGGDKKPEDSNNEHDTKERENLFKLWAELGEHMQGTHPASRRIVTTHGDFHPGNFAVFEKETGGDCSGKQAAAKGSAGSGVDTTGSSVVSAKAGEATVAEEKNRDFSSFSRKRGEKESLQELEEEQRMENWQWFIFDLEFMTVSRASLDLAKCVACAVYDGSKGERGARIRAFLKGYLRNLKSDESGVDFKKLAEHEDSLKQLWVDCELTQMTGWHTGGVLAQWELRDADKLKNCVQFAKRMCESVWLDEVERELLLSKGIGGYVSNPLQWEIMVAGDIGKSGWYKRMQDDLDDAGLRAAVAAGFAAGLKMGASVTEGAIAEKESASPTDEGLLLTIACSGNPDLLLQPRRHGTSSGSSSDLLRLELGKREESCENQHPREESCENQQFKLIRNADAALCFELQHVASGLFLDADVGYAFFQRGKCWEGGSEGNGPNEGKKVPGEPLLLRERNFGDSQRFVFDQWRPRKRHSGEVGDSKEDAFDLTSNPPQPVLIRQFVGGRALNVNFWKLERGMGVNLNVPAGTKENGAGGFGFQLQFAEHDAEEKKLIASDMRRPTEHGVEQRKKHGIERKEHLHLGVFPSGPHAFDVADENRRGRSSAETGRRMREARLAKHEKQKPIMPQRVTIAEGEEGTVFLIKPAAARTTCLGVREKPRNADEPYEVCLVMDPLHGNASFEKNAEFENSTDLPGHITHRPAGVTERATLRRKHANVLWRVVDKDKFQHVETGLFLDSDFKYSHCVDNNHIWEDNHTGLVVRERTELRETAETDERSEECRRREEWAQQATTAQLFESIEEHRRCQAVERDFDSQRWVLGPEEFHGGRVLRHYLDGRGVDVHGWDFKTAAKGTGGNVGCENSIHSDCRGISYILELV